MQPSIVYEQPTAPRRHVVLKIIIGFVVLLIIAGITFLVVRNVHHTGLENEVKTELIKQNKLIKATAKGDIFPETLPKGVKTTNKVTIDATVSATGEAYCITGTSRMDTKISFYMGKDTPEDAPVAGSCDDNATIPPSVPANVAVGSVGAGAISLTWDKAPFASVYTIQCATDQSFVNGLTSKIVANTSASIENLTGNDTYYCRVAANNNVGQSAWTSVVSAQVATVSIAPTHLKVITVSRTELAYSWSAVPGARSYVVEYSTDTNFAVGVVQVTTNTTSGSIKNLQPNTAYNFHVKAVTAGFDAAHAAFSGIQLGRTAK